MHQALYLLSSDLKEQLLHAHFLKEYLHNNLSVNRYERYSRYNRYGRCVVGTIDTRDPTSTMEMADAVDTIGTMDMIDAVGTVDSKIWQRQDSGNRYDTYTIDAVM